MSTLDTTTEIRLDAHAPTTIIRPTAGWAPINFAELWRYRELFGFLTWRDVKIRYKQTAFGAAWAVGQPLLGMIIFTILFGRLARIETGTVPYALFAYAGLIMWNLFANSLGQAAISLVQNVHLVSKVYFPRLALPTASVLSYVVDWAVSFALLLVLIVAYGEKLRWTLLIAPVFVVSVVTTALGMGFLLAALAARYRDVKFALPFVIQIWFFAVPIIYPLDLIHRWRWLYSIDPMVGPIDAFRWASVGSAFHVGPFVISTASGLAMLLVGAYYFRRVERSFADVI